VPTTCLSLSEGSIEFNCRSSQSIKPYPWIGRALKDFANDLQKSADKDIKESLDSTTVSAVALIEQQKKKQEQQLGLN